jgi:L-ribulose-5-phosphate 3-epimerase
MKLQLGLMASLSEGPDEALAKVAGMGFPTCQLANWHVELYTRANVAAVRSAARRHGVAISTLWAGYPGPMKWNLIAGPRTLGLPPKAWRAMRVRALKKGADFAVACGIGSITTHVGFIPEDPRHPDYAGTVRAVRQVALHCRRLGLEFRFETGQETPVTLLRAIEDIAMDNLGINLDPANLILYGKANPVDALDVFGKYVVGVHAKDGLYPTDGRALGREVALGEGKVNFPALIPKLYRLGFRGALTIEREISGPQQVRDILRGKKFLEGIVRRLR